MENIKDINKLIVSDFDLVVELKQRVSKSGIITSNKVGKNPLGYGVIVIKGEKVEDLEVGDIILQTRVENVPGFTSNKREYIVIARHAVLLATKKDNFIGESDEQSNDEETGTDKETSKS